MKIVNISTNDFANFSYDISQALKSVGFDSDSYCLNKHPFDYPEQSTLITTEDVLQRVKDADIINIMHSDTALYEIVKSLNKRVYVWHTGTHYRIQHNHYNAVFKNCKPIIALGEFKQWCPKAEYVVGAMRNIDPFYGGKTLSHFPSNPEVQGTKQIDQMMLQVENKDWTFRCETNKVGYIEQMERMKDCSIYIEMFALRNNGLPYGSWGITCLEAAMMGKLVVTNHTTYDVYKEVYGSHPLFIPHTGGDFCILIHKLLNLPDWQRKELQEKTRQWVIDNHSYEATGKRLQQLYEL